MCRKKLMGTSIAFLLCLSVSAAQTQIVPVDAEISDAEVLALVDRGYPGLEEFAAAMAAGDLGRAHALLARHFATRSGPRVPPAEFPGITEGVSMTVLRKVSRQVADEQWLKHIYTYNNNDVGRPETHELGPTIHWLQAPSARSWGGYLNQLNMIAGLAGLYNDTGDDKYVTEIGNLLISWVAQVPRWYGYTENGRHVPSGMEVRNRLCNCIAAYDVVARSEAFSLQAHMAFWKLLITACRELMTYSGVSYPGLIPAAVMFPEFIEAPQWLEAGKADIRRQLVDRTTPEGAWDTHSISYQTVPVPWAARSLEFLRLRAGDPDLDALAAMVRNQAGKLVEMMLRLTMPNGGLPNIGDTYGRYDWNPSAFLPHLTSWMALKLSAEERARLEGIADPFARLKAALAIADGTGSDEPAAASYGYPGTGYYVMRSGWDPVQARYLYFDLSAQATGHAHNDACHFDLYAYGKPLLCDTGDYFLGWGLRTALHNTIEVDGQQQARGADAPMMPIEWLTTPGYDFVDGAHGAYGGLGVVHRRRIFFVKPDYFILADLLTGEGAHSFEQFFHFAGATPQTPAQVRLDQDTLAALGYDADIATAQIIPAGTEGLRAEFAQAQETDMSPDDKYDRAAMLGWMVTTGTFHRMKSPVVVYTREGQVPQAFHDVLFPVPPESQARVSVQVLPASEDGRRLPPEEAIGLEIRCELDRPAHAPDQILPELGPNLALGRQAFAEINEGSFPEGDSGKLTDGERGPRIIAAALSSAPYSPGVPLRGRFGVALGAPTRINCVVLHLGTWNGSQTLYVPESLTVQYREGEQWRDVPSPTVKWRDDTVAEVWFDAVTTSAVSVAVERPSGGRLSMREFEVHCVAEEELRRVAALRAERSVERWADVFLISHVGPGQRSYGDYSFDGEIALIRRGETGDIRRLLVHRGAHLSSRGQEIFSVPAPVDTLTATWENGAVTLDCSPPAVIRANERGGLVAAPVAAGPELQITDLQLQLHPAQPGLGGGQPWATLTWRTDRPATTQVEYQGPLGLLRRTILDRSLTNDHAARVEFLRPGEQYLFRAVSVDAQGRRAQAQAQ